MDTEIIIRFLLAALWGGIVGAEREYRSKSAGFRTMIMISVGSCLFTMMSVFIGGVNPDRIAANIVTGIGFLGAGVIFRSENRITGITTAAAIWSVAAVGMGIGAGYYITTAYAATLIVIVLALLPYAERLIDILNQSRTYRISFRFAGLTTEYFETLMRSNRLHFKETCRIKDGGLVTITWEVHGTAKRHQALISALMNDERVERFEY